MAAPKGDGDGEGAGKGGGPFSCRGIAVVFCDGWVMGGE